MSGEFGPTNLLLGIMAAASVLEVLVIIGVAVAGFMAYRKVRVLVDGIETRQVAPAMARVNAILDDVKVVTTTVKEEAERVDHAIHTRAKTSALVGVVRGLRVAIEGVLHSRHQAHET